MTSQYPTPDDLQVVVLDAETYYADDYSLSKMATSTYVRDERFKEHLWGVRWPNGQYDWLTGDAFRLAAKHIDWSKTAIVGHNLRFDGLILSLRHGINPALWVDTLGMARAVIGSRVARHGLDALAQHLGGKGKLRKNALLDTKNKRDLSAHELNALGTYCIDDVADTWHIFDVMRRFFPAKEYWFLDWATRMATEPKLVFDMDTLQEAYDDEVALKAKLLAQVPYNKTNLGSNPQFAEILRSKGVEPPTKTSKTTGRETFDFSKNSIQFRELETHPDPSVQAVIAARMAVKSTIKESRAMRFMGLAEEGPWCVPLNYAGAMNTSRFSGGDKQNPQNLSSGSKLRDSIVAPRGHLVVAVDSSGIELRVAATLAGERDVVARAVAGEDEYARFASVLYGYDVNKHDHPEERKVGKVAVLSLGYQSAAATYRGMLFAQTGIVKPMDVCEQVVSTYRATYSRYPVLWRAMDQRVRMLAEGNTPPNLPTNPPIRWDANGYTSLYSGARVSYPRIHERLIAFNETDEPRKALVYLDMRRAKAGESEGWATIYGGKATENLSQFLAREVVNYQTHHVWQVTGLRPQLQVHDEIVYVVPEEKAHTFYEVVKKLMSGPIPWWPDLITSASGGVERSYGDIDK